MYQTVDKVYQIYDNICEMPIFKILILIAWFICYKLAALNNGESSFAEVRMFQNKNMLCEHNSLTVAHWRVLVGFKRGPFHVLPGSWQVRAQSGLGHHPIVKMHTNATVARLVYAKREQISYMTVSAMVLKPFWSASCPGPPLPGSLVGDFLGGPWEFIAIACCFLPK